MEEQAAKRKKTMCDWYKRQQQTETDEQAAKHKKTMCDRNKRQQQTETEEQAAKRKKTIQDCMRRKREEMKHQSHNNNRGCNGNDMTNVIDHSTKEAKKNYTEHRIQQTPISIGQLCVLYVIVSSSAQKPFTNLPRKTLAHIVKDLVSKVMKSTTK
jgi:hypothetical protein